MTKSCMSTVAVSPNTAGLYESCKDQGAVSVPPENKRTSPSYSVTIPHMTTLADASNSSWVLYME